MKEQFMMEINQPPYRLSGTVYGVLMNDPASLAALGEQVNQPPYKAAPRAPVLYVKPRNTLATSGAQVAAPDGQPALVLGATLGLVLARAASRVPREAAWSYLAGVVLAADVYVPHDSFYRPSVRFKALDHSCLLGSQVLPLRSDAELAALGLSVQVQGGAVQTVGMQGWARSAAQLLSEVSDFMTLARGDVLLMGLRHAAPQVARGQRFSVSAPGLSVLEGGVA